MYSLLYQEFDADFQVAWLTSNWHPCLFFLDRENESRYMKYVGGPDNISRYIIIPVSTGWGFGTFFIFPSYWEEWIIPTVTHSIFQRGRLNRQPEQCSWRKTSCPRGKNVSNFDVVRIAEAVVCPWRHYLFWAHWYHGMDQNHPGGPHSIGIAMKHESNTTIIGSHAAKPHIAEMKIRRSGTDSYIDAPGGNAGQFLLVSRRNWTAKLQMLRVSGEFKGLWHIIYYPAETLRIQYLRL